MSTALQKAMAGEAVSDKAAPNALKEAAEKLRSLKEKFTVAKENASATAMSGVHAVETLTVLAASGAAEGYWGEEKMKLGPVPIRASVGVLLMGWGLASQLTGGNGGHQLAIGTGFVGADAFSLGRQAGVALREKQKKAANGGGAANGGAADPNAPAPTPAQQALIAANPGARLVGGKVIAANGNALEGDDLGELARLIRMQKGTAGEGERALARRDTPAGVVRAKRAA